MATKGTKAGKSSAKSRTSKTEAKTKTVERRFDHKLDKDRILTLIISIASGPMVGPGPKPKKDAFHCHYRVGKGQVLSINSSITSGSGDGPKSGSKVGNGPRPKKLAKVLAFVPVGGPLVGGGGKPRLGGN